MCRSVARVLWVTVFVASMVLAVPTASAATKAVDLDGKSTNGSESSVALNILQSAPVKVENVVTNKAINDAFSFIWYSAGPGYFTSSVAAGTSTGRSTKWTWSTNSIVSSYVGNSCTNMNDICFTKTAGPDPVTTRGPFSVPGRSLSSSGVTVSNASLTSSIITQFSPWMILVTATSSVGQVGSDLAYTTSYTNSTTQPITIEVAPYPPGCCDEPNQLNCDGNCVDYLTDSDNCGDCGNVCEAGTFCSDGVCVQECPEGLTACDGSCVDLQSDPLNCGSCASVCGDNQICTGGVCDTCRPPDQTACPVPGSATLECVNIHTDSRNCGGCGVDCNFLCPSTGHGTCSQGQSCFCVSGNTLSVSTRTLFPKGLRDPAPLCQLQPFTQTIEPGDTFTSCNTSPLLATEVPTTLTVTGPDIPGGVSSGTFNVLTQNMTQIVCDPTDPVEGCHWAFLTPYKVVVKDQSKDGLLMPGEWADLFVSVSNAGPFSVSNPLAGLSSPPLDLTVEDPPVNNPMSATITPLTPVAYSPNPIQGSVGSGDCSQQAAPNPSTNVAAYKVTLPSNYPGDVAALFNLHFTGSLINGPFEQDVPFVVGVRGRCDIAAGARDYDAVDGLLNPLAALSVGDPVFPTKSITYGKTLPLKLRLLCGTSNLTGSEIDPPEIIAISEATLGPINISAINLDDDANSNNPFFRFNTRTQQWIYNARTKVLPIPSSGTGVYVLTLRIANRKDYVTGFVLQR